MHQVVLGPAPCMGCGVWVEWSACCGWLALASDEAHDCRPYLEGPRVWLGPPPAAAAAPSLVALAVSAWYGQPVRVQLTLAAIGMFAALVLARLAAGLL